MKTKSYTVGILAAGLMVVGATAPSAQGITDEEFRAMQQQMQQQAQEMKELRRERAQDRQEIQQLKQKLGQTEQKAGDAQKTATEAQKTLQETQKTVQETQKTAIDAAAKAMAAQSEESAVKRNFYFGGFSDVLYQKTNRKDGSFLFGHFNPLFLFRAGDNVLFEAEPEFHIENNGEAGFGLEYAQIDYVLNDYATLVAGRIVAPLGFVREKTDAMWIDKLPTQPITEADGTGLIPESDLGVELRGGFHPINDSPLSLMYTFFLANGPGSARDADGHEISPPGLTYPNIGENVTGQSGTGMPNGGGRVAVFYPWKAHTDLEVGLSGQTGPWNENNDLFFSALLFDATLHLGPHFELRGEYVKTFLDLPSGLSPGSTMSPHGHTSIDSEGYWVQAAYKLAGLNLDVPMINNVELVYRFGAENRWDGHIRQHDVGFVYHVTNALLVKGAYEFNESNIRNPDEPASTFDHDGIILQAVFAF